jgi:hypothetical protein
MTHCLKSVLHFDWLPAAGGTTRHGHRSTSEVGMRGLACAVVALLFIPSHAAGSASPAPRAQAPECALTALERQLVEEVVTELFNDAVWVAESADGVDRGFALSLVGLDAGHIGHVTRIGQCGRSETFVPFCERDVELPITRCSRLGCEAAGVDTVEGSLSGGKPKYKKRTTLRYDATTFAGTVTYDPYPSVVWRTVEAASGTYAVSASVFRRPVVTPTGSAPIDLTHSGSIAIKVVGGEITSLEIDLAFPLLLAGEPHLVLDASFDAAGVGTGSLRRGTETLATISGDRTLAITWNGSCGQ